MTTARRSTSRSAAETENLGGHLAAELRGGDVLLLEAELAAGKTTATITLDHRVLDVEFERQAEQRFRQV